MGRSIGGVLLLSGLLATSGVSAAAGDSLRARIPFEFGAGGTVFSSGDCNFDLSRDNKVSVSCSRTRATVQASTLAFTGSVYEVADRKEIIFNRYGGSYFLSQVWIKDEGRELTTSDAEKELQASGAEGTAVKLKVR